MALIEVTNVAKSFTVREPGSRLRRRSSMRTAVSGLTFTVARGELVGYIGPNGAGKSTTVKMLTGILTPTSGHLRVAGLDPARHRRELTRHIGVVFGQRTTLWWDLPLRDSLQMVRHLYRMDAGRHRENLERYVSELGLGPILSTPVRQLSLGQRVRGDLAAALLHDPEVLYLDEPTIGLDLVSKGVVRRLLADVNARQGTTIVLTTHDLDDIERLCGRIMVIDHGRLVHDGDMDSLRARAGARSVVVVDLARPARPIDCAPAHVVRAEGTRQWIEVEDALTTGAVIAQVCCSHDVVDIAVHEPDIEEVVARIYAGAAAPLCPMGEGAMAAHAAMRETGCEPPWVSWRLHRLENVEPCRNPTPRPTTRPSAGIRLSSRSGRSGWSWSPPPRTASARA